MKRICRQDLLRLPSVAAFFLFFICSSFAQSTIPIADGGVMYYEETGSGEPVLLLHGHTLDRRMWDGQVEYLKESFRLIVPDMRGYGKTTVLQLIYALFCKETDVFYQIPFSRVTFLVDDYIFRVVQTRTAVQPDLESDLLGDEEISIYFEMVDTKHQYEQIVTSEWEQYKKTMAEFLSDAKLCAITFCRGTRRSYIFVLHEETADRFGLMIRQFLQTRWSRMFVPERVEGYELLMPKKSEEFKVTLKNGEVMTLWTEDEEDVCVKFSGSNYLLKLKADYFASYFRH